MKLPEIQQVAFQGAAQGQAFAPVQVPDPNPGLQAKLAVIANSFQNMETSGIQEYKRQEVSAKQMQQLYEFLPNAMQQVAGMEIQRRESEAKSAVAAKLSHLSPEKLEQALSDYEKRRQEAQKLGDAAAPEIRKMSREGLAEEAGFMIGVTGRAAVYRDIEVAKMLGTVLPEWAAKQRKTNTGTVFIENHGEVTINDPNLSETLSDLVIEKLKERALGVDEVAGQSSLPMEIIAKHTIPVLNQNISQIKKRFHKEIRSRRGTSQRADLNRKMVTDVGDSKISLEELGTSFQTFITTAAATNPVSGENYGIGEGKAGDQFIDTVVEAKKAGMPFDIDRFGDAITSNGPVRKHYFGLFNKLSNKLKDAETQGFKNRRAQSQADVQQRVAAFLSEIQNNPGQYSTEDGARFIKTVLPQAQLAGLDIKSSGLLNVRSTILEFGKGAEARTGDIKSAIEQFADGTLRETHPLYNDELGRTHWTFEYAKKYTEQNDTEYHQQFRKELDAVIGDQLQSARAVNGSLISGQGVVNHAYLQELPSLNAKLQAAETPQEKAAVVLQETERIKKEYPPKFKTGSGDIYELNASKRMFRWEQQQAARGSEADKMVNRLSHLTDVAKSGGNVFSELHNNPSSFAARDEVVSLLPKVLAGQPLPRVYGFSVDHLNAAAGKEIFKDPMQVYATLLRSYEPELYKSSNLAQVVQQYQAQSPRQKAIMNRLMNGDRVNVGSVFLSSNTGGRGSFENNLPVRAVTGSIPHPLNNQPGYTLPNITPLAGATKAQLVNIPDDAFRWLAYGASGEAGPGDDIYGVAASIINRYAEGRGSFEGIVTAYNPRTGLYQYEAVGKGLAKFRPDLEAEFRSPAGRAKLVEALIKLQGRTDFKGRSQYQYAGRTDVMFNVRGNTFHHPEERSKGDVYSGPPKNAWRKFVSGL